MGGGEKWEGSNQVAQAFPLEKKYNPELAHKEQHIPCLALGCPCPEFPSVVGNSGNVPVLLRVLETAL